MVKHYHQSLNRVLIAVLLLWSTAAWAQVNWPNEPSGATVISDHNWSTCPGGGWTPANSCGNVTSDATAPFSPPSILRFDFNTSTGHGGGDPFLVFTSTDTIYLGFWWRPSNPYQGYSTGKNKIAFIFSTANGLVYLSMTGPQFGSFAPTFELEFPGVSNSHLTGFGDPVGTWVYTADQTPYTLTLGQWHRVEILLRGSTTTTSKDGQLRLWINGTLTHGTMQLNTPSSQWNQISLSPSWDGSELRSNPDRQEHDHVRVSVPNCGAQGCPEPTPAWPNEPTGTTELLDFAFNVTQGSGLDDVNETGVIVSDSTAPLSPVNVFRSRLQNGIAPGGVELRYDLPDLTEMFAGVWWKPNTTFQGLQSGFNRLMGFAQNESNAYLAWVGAQNLSGLSGSIQFYMPLGATAMNNCHLTGWQGNCPGEGRLLPNMSTCTINATDDEWHRIELYVRRSASAIDRTGIVRWWVDGNLCGNYDPQAGTGVNWGPSGFDYWFWTEAWTTVPAGQSADWIHYLDHLYLSRPQGATSVDVMPPGPVTSFTVTIPGGPPPPDPPPVGISPGAEWFQFF